MIRFVPATQELIERFYGHPQQYTVTAYAVMVDDDPDPKAIGGFIRYRPGIKLLFCDSIESERKSHKLTTLKFAKMLLQVADKNGWVLAALPEDADIIPEAVDTLEHLGFQYNEEQELYLR